jgi:hypothetical protein
MGAPITPGDIRGKENRLRSAGLGPPGAVLSAGKSQANQKDAAHDCDEDQSNDQIW